MLTELVEGIPFFRPGRPAMMLRVRRALSSSLIVRSEQLPEQFLLRCNPLPRLALQDMHFECSEFDLVEAQSFEPSGSTYSRSVRVQSSTGMNCSTRCECRTAPGCAESADSCDPLLIVASVGFDIFVNWHASTTDHTRPASSTIALRLRISLPTILRRSGYGAAR